MTGGAPSPSTPTLLEGLRVLDLTQGIAGPACTKLLAQWGADVVKVERPGGDVTRSWAPFVADEPGPDRGLTFLTLNEGKRSVTLDLRDASEWERFASLVRWADVVVESYTPQTAAALGVTYEALAAIKADLVLVSVTSFGQTGPYRDYEATEVVEYALSGLMYHIGDPDREPLVHSVRPAIR